MADRPASALDKALSRFDPRTVWFGWGRTLIATAHLITLALTPTAALLHPLLNESPYPHCQKALAVSAYCVGGDAVSQEWRRWIMVILLAVVASGYRPRWTVWIHAWLLYSIGVSIALPDGGEAIARVAGLLLIPMGLADDRRWHWQRPSTPIGPTARGTAFAAVWALRVQLVILYVQSGVSKFGVPDWLNGSAEYYILRDPIFGAAEPFEGPARWLSGHGLTLGLLTWGGIVIELVIAAFLVGPERLRKAAFVLDVVLHASIIATIGLWSFSLIMIGCAAVAAAPDRTPLAAPRVPPLRKEPRKWQQTRSSNAPKAMSTGAPGSTVSP
ncbi:HTTM domain-containing protein [Streptomyces roseoverticillatus]|uniref:sporulation-delaying protein SdpB family protein n=1 Tax=Streptomyces roseoverticillatus TaxID=66429 RepID=UPI001F49062A|nr:sporulation-delaying protein SdpB family protein [Streptomyces roseoverticillatus]MCF3106589.1 HTTM domain-containing protein [Streptomyces roseoverticillatus]